MDASRYAPTCGEMTFVYAAAAVNRLLHAPRTRRTAVLTRNACIHLSIRSFAVRRRLSVRRYNEQSLSDFITYRYSYGDPEPTPAIRLDDQVFAHEIHDVVSVAQLPQHTTEQQPDHGQWAEMSSTVVAAGTCSQRVSRRSYRTDAALGWYALVVSTINA